MRDLASHLEFTFPTQVLVTLSLSYMVGTIASFHDTVAVIITMGATLAITVAIIAFSAQVRQARAAAFPFYTVYTHTHTKYLTSD